jgi:predicted dehydrogenase
MGKARLGLGVIGTGGWARGFWHEAQQAPEVELVACWDQLAENASKFGEMYRCRPAASLEALLGDPRVQAVTIFTPNNAHRAPAEAAAAAGKHVFTEKPIANSVADAVAIMGACKSAGVTLMVGHSTRYGGRSRALKSLLDQGRLGQLAMAEANISHSGGTRITAAEWRWHRDEAPGGPLMQLSVHAFDTLHYFFGPTRRITAVSTSALLPSEIEDVFLTLLEFESGLLAYVGTNYMSPPVSFVHIYGTGGNACWRDDRVTYTRVTGPWSTESEEIQAPTISATAAEMTEFARAIRTRTPPETGGREGLLALGVVWACLMSAERGCAVEVKEALGEGARLVG